VRDERVRAVIQADIDAANQRFADRADQALRDPRSRPQPRGRELTPTLKVKHSVVHTRYADLFAALYEEDA